MLIPIYTEILIIHVVAQNDKFQALFLRVFKNSRNEFGIGQQKEEERKIR